MKETGASITVFEVITLEFLAKEHFLHGFKVDQFAVQILLNIQKLRVIPFILQSCLDMPKITFHTTNPLRNVAEMMLTQLLQWQL